MGVAATICKVTRGRSRARAIFVVAALVSMCACWGATPPKVIKIGVDLPLVGADGRAGMPVLNGVRFFVEQHPTLDGYTIEITSRDDAVDGADDPSRGASNVKALVADPLVLGVIGPFDSSVARKTIPIANTAHLALISPTVSSRCLTKEPYLAAGLSPSRTAVSCAAAGFVTPAELRPAGTNNFFRLATTDDLQGPAAADFAYKNLGVRRVAVLSDHEAYGQALAAGFTTRFEKQGGSVVATVDFDPNGSTDFRVFLRAAKADGAQAIYYGGVTRNHGCVIRAQMASIFPVGEAMPYLGGDGIAQDPDCVRHAGANAIGIYATVPTAMPDTIAGAQPVIAAFKAHRHNAADYSAYTIAAYDSAGVLYAAIDSAIKGAGGKLPTRDRVVDRLAATAVFTGAGGTFGFDASGDTTKRLVTVYESRSADPAQPWALVVAVDYSMTLPY
jgi:branched-chain amino acid transport system substrate-binding protein